MAKHIKLRKLVFILMVMYQHCYGLDITDCQNEWLQTSFGGYAYRVDCSNLGFISIPKNLPTLTSELLLNGNSISSVDDQAFTGLKSLHTIDLSGNDIVSVPVTIFEKTDTLKKLDLSRNKLFCDWRLWWLVDFVNKLESFDGKCFSPRPLRGKLIKSLTQKDLSVDCLSIKKLTGTSRDGEYLVRVYGHDNSETEISIFCHGMKSDSPKEFLTLPSGEHNNYVKIVKNENCDYEKDSGLKSILTEFPNQNTTSHFNRIRVELVSLKLIVTDTTFASHKHISYGQPSVCGTNICMSGISRIDLRGTPFQLKESKQIIKEDTCSSACGMCQKLQGLDLDLIDKSKQPFPACTLPLGMQNNHISDSSISASSFAGKPFLPNYARLNSLSFSGWCALMKDDYQYLLVDLGKEMTLSGIATQGHKDNKDWVTAYKILYSTDGEKYRRYHELGKKKTLTGNHDSNTVVTHWFQPRFRAQLVKVHPLSWNDGGILERRICMRIELYGCDNDITSYIIKKSPENECLTSDFSVKKEEYRVNKKPACTGPDFMFTYHHRRLKHTKTGLCLNVNYNSAFVLNKTCTSPNLMFQKVRHAAGESFLIKDLNGHCAQLNDSNGKLYSNWQFCLKGGFTILQMARDGVSAFLPYFEVSESTIQTDLFKPVTISCKAHSDPYAVYKWTKKSPAQSIEQAIDFGVAIKNDHSILSFKNISWEDRGTYKCHAWNSEGSAIKRYEIIINPIQWFQSKPSNQNIIYGKTATFLCVSKGIPEPKITWFLYENITSIYRPISDFDNEKFQALDDGSLQINKVEYNDETTYVCCSTSPGLERNTSAVLTVYVTQNFTTVPQSAHVLYGDDTLFDCVSEGDPKPRVEWNFRKFDGVIAIDESMQHHYEVLSNGSLLIKKVTIADEGDVLCLSFSPGLVRSVEASLTVYVTQTFEKSPANKKTLYHHNATFECVSIGQPTPVVYWTRKIGNEYIRLKNDSKYVITSTNTLHVQHVDYKDETEYWCMSESPRLNRNVSATLDVYVTQQFVLMPKDQKLLYGSNHTLKCLSVGIPEPVLSWELKHSTRNMFQSIKSMNNLRYNLVDDGSLQIIDATLNESGVYSCVSNSPGLVRNRSANIEVYVTQSFPKKPKSQTLLRGDLATFECVSIGVPKPKVYWMFKGLQTAAKTYEEMLKDNRYEFTSDRLIIKNVQNRDEGKYACISESPGRIVDVSANLIVHIKPQLSLSTYEDEKLVGQEVEVTCTTAGDPTPDTIWYKLKGDSNETQEEVANSNKLKFEKLQKGNSGRYACEAKNLAGSAREVYTLSVKATCTLDNIAYSVERKKYIYIENENAIIKCQSGFLINGSSLLKCASDGNWIGRIPSCEDIDECNVGDNNEASGAPTTDDEPDVCDVNAQCINSIGSYQCLCDEGYSMINSKCEFSPPGSSSTEKPKSIISTTPPPLKYVWLTILIQEYNQSLIDEEAYLSRLKDFSKNISSLVYPSWKVDAIKKLLMALNVALEATESKKVKPDNIKIYASIVNDILYENMMDEWKSVDEVINGTVLVMKYLEEYIVKNSKALTEGNYRKENIAIFYDNFDIILEPVKSSLQYEPLKISDSKNGFDFHIPSENYPLLQGSVGITIVYKTLHKLLPQPVITNVESPKILSNVISLSFSSGDTSSLVKPMQLKFKFSEKIIPSERLCSHWDFKKPYGGDWSTEGCQPLNTSASMEVICECNHLTNFALIVPQKTVVKVIYLTFSLSVAIGAAVCVFLAFIVCMSHVCCPSYSRSDRRCILCNLTLIIVLGIIVFAGGVLISSMKLIPSSFSSYFCFSLLGTLQLFGVAFFGWLFAEAIHLYLSTRTVIDKKQGHLTLFYVLGWGLPLGILAATGVLVYLDKFRLQSRCILHVSFYLVGIIVGAPSIFFILATIVLYVVISITMHKNKDLLSTNIISHTRRALLCSGGLIIIHLLVIAAASAFLHFNTNPMFHHILGGVIAFEGVYLIFYHCYLDRKDGKLNSRQNSKKRTSYSTQEIVTYSPSNTNEMGTDTNDQKYLVKRSSKRYSGDPSKPSPPQLRTQSSSDALNQDNHYAGMYGSPSNESSPETRPLLPKQHNDDPPETIYEENDNEDAGSLPTFGHPGTSRTNSVPSSRHNSLPRKKPQIWDDVSIDGSHKPIKRSNSKASSIVSIETHTSLNDPKVIPVYFPSAPPHYEMSLQQNQSQMNNIDSYLESASPSARTSLGIDPDRMSNLSSELSNILFELQAFDTERHPSEMRGMLYSEPDTKSLPHRRQVGETDLSRSSTFKPQRGYAKTEVQYETGGRPSLLENNRVRLLRGRTRAEADPSDGLHHNSDSIYSSL